MGASKTAIDSSMKTEDAGSLKFKIMLVEGIQRFRYFRNHTPS